MWGGALTIAERLIGAPCRGCESSTCCAALLRRDQLGIRLVRSGLRITCYGGLRMPLNTHIGVLLKICESNWPLALVKYA